jgi:hypothetical protein
MVLAKRRAGFAAQISKWAVLESKIGILLVVKQITTKICIELCKSSLRR